MGGVIFTVYTFFERLDRVWAFAASIILVTLASLWVVKRLLDPLVRMATRFDILLKETLHELNIPIATIQANATMLKKNLENPKSLRQLERMVEASQHLLVLHQTLEQKIKRQFHAAPKNRIDLQSFLQSRIDAYGSIYPQAHFATHLTPMTIDIDTFGLQQSIDNLVANAIKYSPSPAQVTITLAPPLLTIEDKGKGIAQDELLRIFERFYQADESAQGMGVGLAVVKGFCDQNRITLSIDSKPEAFTKVVLNFANLTPKSD